MDSAFIRLLCPSLPQLDNALHDVFGLGKDTVMVLDNQSDGMQAFANGKWVHIAVP